MSRTGALLFVLLISLSPIPSRGQPSPPSPTWTGEESVKIAGLMKVWGTVQYAFPYLDRLAEIDWDQRVQDCIPNVLEAKTPDEYYPILMELVARLGDSHTLVLPPWGYLKPGFDTAPLELRWIDGRFYVARTGDRPDLLAEGVGPGAEIVTVDGVPTAERFADSVLRYHNWGSDHASAAAFAVYLLYGPAGGTNVVGVRTPGGELREVEIARDAMSGDPPFMTRQLENAFVRSTIRTHLLPGDIQYVDIPNFDHEEALVDFQAMIDAIEPGDVEGMIIDLRYNMGGSSSVSEPMVACLIDTPVNTPTMKYRSYSGAGEAWGQGPEWHEVVREIDPGSGARYRGPIVVLVGNLTHSSAEDFALELRAAGRAKLVGQLTAGGSGNALVTSLPGGGTLRVATFTALTQQGEEYVGYGVEPDLRVEITPDDLAAGRDPVLQRAIALLSGD